MRKPLVSLDSQQQATILRLWPAPPRLLVDYYAKEKILQSIEQIL